MANIIQRSRRPNVPVLRDFFNIGSFFDNGWMPGIENKFPAVNISENEKEYDLEVVVPGFRKEDIKVRVEDDMLTISAESKSESQDGEKEYTRREYTYSAFTRNFQLPENVRSDNLEAHYEDGVLHIKIPKSQNHVKNSKEVPVS